MAGNAAIATSEAKKLGYKVKFICINMTEYADAVINPCTFADEVHEVNTYDITKLLHFFEDEKESEKIEVIVAFDDFRIVQAAILNAKYTHKGATLESILACRFKDIMRKAVSHLKQSVAYEVIDFKQKYDSSPIGYPCVVKPNDESGSVGVKICHSNEEFIEAVNNIYQLTSPNCRGYQIATKILVEEYIPGDEYSAEMVWNPDLNEWLLLGVTKKFVSPPPYCVEVGHIFPFGDAQFEKEVELQLKEVLATIGFKNSFAHVEFKVIGGVLKLIEINPRVGGDQIPELMKLAKHIDPIALYLRASLGIRFEALELDKKQQQSEGKTYAAICFLFSTKEGEVSQLKIGSNFEHSHKTHLAQLPKKIKGLTSTEDRLGFVIQTFSSTSQAINFIESTSQKIAVEVYADE